MFKRASKTFVALQCQTCGSVITEHEMDEFKDLRIDRQNGTVPIKCGCIPIDTPHKIVGVVEERQIPLKPRSVFKKMKNGEGKAAEEAEERASPGHPDDVGDRNGQE